MDYKVNKSLQDDSAPTFSKYVIPIEIVLQGNLRMVLYNRCVHAKISQKYS